MTTIRKAILRKIIEKLDLDIPHSAYERAEARYKSLGEWFGRDGGTCAGFSPLISSQGSFRLGTVVKSDEYDLDFTCKLREVVTIRTHTQEELKRLIGEEMEAYRTAHTMTSPLEAKHRCWRLKYADQLKFHMDVVPAIPHEAAIRLALTDAMVRRASLHAHLAEAIAETSCAITDDRDPFFRTISSEWPSSNPEGYALWFDSRVSLGSRERGDVIAGTADVDDLPAMGRSTLQQCVKILKRHRDLMFVDFPEGKPISIIITTLAARAYGGEQDVGDAIEGCLSEMEGLLRESRFRVLNPVNPDENFTDKWWDPVYAHLDLPGNFSRWVKQAKRDFGVLGEPGDARILADATGRFGGRVDQEELRLLAGSTVAPRHVHHVSDPPRPWLARWR